MAYRSFRQFLMLLTSGELKRVAIPVDTELLIAEWADREMKSPGGGKAMLFEQPIEDGKNRNSRRNQHHGIAPPHGHGVKFSDR